MFSSAPRASPCRRTYARPGGAGAGRPGRPARLAPSAPAPRARRARRRRRPLAGARRRGAHARARPPRSDRAVSPPSGGHYDSCHARFRSRRPNARARRRPVGEPIVWGDSAARVALAGHLDTVPAQGNLPGRIDDGAVHGLGASDMKGGVAVMLELARAEAPARYLFVTREEVALEESPLPAAFASGVLAGTELAVVLEPTDAILHAGCLGNLQARVEFHGESAHSARPWTGSNAIHALAEGLAPLARLEPLEVELDGLVYREVLSVVGVEGGIAQNVVPALAAAELNFRFAPDRSRDEAEARLRELVPDGELHVLHNSPSAPPARGNPLVDRLRELVPEVAPKQAWTPVAQFAEQGIDAINYGPGATAYAHRQDEQIPIENLHAVYETLHAFLGSV